MKTGMTVKIPPAAAPLRNLKMINSVALSAKYIKTHPMICGNATRKIVNFLPISLAAYPKNKVPASPPTVKIDPIKDASLIERMPQAKGVSLDCKNGIAALVHPVDKPYDKLKRFAQKAA